ncbi:MAG: CDP-2,3-bis-(O-geranylgeranyl)-sn-glycerol synthase [Nanoarchaeota archaeon]|nr:CDP-2,3-bis-(O-geranylgeranyl)-sn-glycerol synthase [Nanoarchaeota archaeon]
MLIEIIVQMLQIAVPAYVANGSPPFLIKLKKHPIDFNLKIKGERILGDGKTIEGFVFASIIAYFTGLLELQIISSINYDGFLNIPPIAFFFIGVGAMIGDSVGSFIKRRLKMKRGQNAGLLDMLDFITGAFLIAWFFVPYNIWSFVLALLITPLVHRSASIIGYKLGFKKEPW